MDFNVSAQDFPELIKFLDKFDLYAGLSNAFRNRLSPLRFVVLVTPPRQKYHMAIFIPTLLLRHAQRIHHAVSYTHLQ